MTEKYLSIKLDPERLIGHIIKAILKGDKVSISASKNDNENINTPDFKNDIYGIAVWVKESQYNKGN